MLSTLTISNYALIDSLEVDFNKGFTVITGETGAGKSILLGGLSLVLGKRADLSSLRVKDQKCIIEGTFKIDTYGLQGFFEENDLDYEDNKVIRLLYYKSFLCRPTGWFVSRQEAGTAPR